MIKKITAGLLVLAVCISCSSYDMKQITHTDRYTDPEIMGGLWSVSFEGGDTYHNAECIYWGITEDISIWKLSDGRIMVQSGAVHAVQD